MRIGATLTVNVTMKVGAVAETLTVTNGPRLVEVTSPIPSTTLDATSIEKMPTNGRRFQDLVVLAPNAQVEIQRGQVALSGSAASTRTSASTAPITTSHSSAASGEDHDRSSLRRFPRKPFVSFRSSRAASPQNSGARPAASSMSSPGPEPIGRRDRLLRQPSPGSRLQQHLRSTAAPTQQQWGGSFAGPIRRDRSFFFGAYEQQDVSTPRAVLFDQLRAFSPTAATAKRRLLRSLEAPFTTTNNTVKFLGRVDRRMAAGSASMPLSGGASSGSPLSAGDTASPATTIALSSNGMEEIASTG